MLLTWPVELPRSCHLLNMSDWRALPRIPTDERFESKVNKLPNGGCWLWIGNVDGKGYGRFRDYAKRRQVLAHRWSYERHLGPIPDGMSLDHLCRKPSCVNPAHLEPVSIRVNILRGQGAGMRNAAKTHCPQGHEFVHTTEAGKLRRRCLTCQRKAVRECMQRKRASSLQSNTTAMKHSDIVPVRVGPVVADHSEIVNPGHQAIKRLRAALYVYHTPNVPEASDPAGVVEVAIRRLSELYLVATKAP